MKLWRFICCLFDAHRLEYRAAPHWRECVDCGERRLTEPELSSLRARRAR